LQNYKLLLAYLKRGKNRYSFRDIEKSKIQTELLHYNLCTRYRQYLWSMQLWCFGSVWFPNCGTRSPSRWYASRATFCSSTQNNIFTAFVFTYRVLLISSCVFVYFSYWFCKNGHYNFSQPFCSCRICVKSGLSNFWSKDIGQNEFSWNKVFSRRYAVTIFIYLFNDNLATGGSLTGAILSCHVELSKYNNARKTRN